MSAVNWLQDYYGEDFKKLNPTVVFEGEYKAVVRLVKEPIKGYSGVGYVLIKKDGKHNASEWKSLHEGIPTQDVMDAMKLTLQQEDNP